MEEPKEQIVNTATIRHYLTSFDAWLKSIASVVVGGAIGVMAQAGYDINHLALLTSQDWPKVKRMAIVGAASGLVHRWLSTPAPPPVASSPDKRQ